MQNLPEHVSHTIRERKLFRPGENVLVAVSGGVDSMVLLHVLHALAGQNRWQLQVAHFNHRLRGRSSDADERFVVATARRLGLKCVCGSADVRRAAKQQGVSIEMAARLLRHEFLARVAQARGCRVIALAHHRDDQVELFFLRLFRGAGLAGLTGMKWSTKSPAHRVVRLVRPLLDLDKSTLAAYAKANRIRFREDASNASPDMLRNRLRHDLLPLIREHFQPRLADVVSRFMNLLGAESEILDASSRSWLSKPDCTFESLPLALRRRVIQLQLRSLGVAEDFDLIERLCLKPETAVSAKAGVILRRARDGRIHLESKAHHKFQNHRAIVEFSEPSGSCRFGGLQLRWQIRTQPGNSARRAVMQESFDAAKIGDRMVLRHWQPGDRFQPIGLKHGVKLQDWFTNRKIPRDRRRELVVATTGTGEIFWVEGERIGDAFKLTPATRRRLVLGWKRT